MKELFIFLSNKMTVAWFLGEKNKRMFAGDQGHYVGKVH